MTTFKFDDTTDFETNLDAFLNHMAADDSEMAAILRAHISDLKYAADDARRRAARADFNARVKSDLDTLLTGVEEQH